MIAARAIPRCQGDAGKCLTHISARPERGTSLSSQGFKSVSKGRFMRSLSAQSLPQLGGQSSILARQKRDHIRLNGLLQRLDEAPVDRQDAVLLDIYRLVFPHAFAEEAVLWPLMRRVLPDGHALTLQVEVEHQQINDLVTELEALDPGSPAHRQVLVRVVDLLREDVRDEEDALLPRLQQVLKPGELRYLGTQWAFVRSIAPTRCHPVVSRRPPGNVLSALPLAVLDRARDAVDLRRARQALPAAVAGRLSGALTRAAHAVEHLPGLQTGERRPTRVEAGDQPVWRSLGIAAGVIASAILLRRRHRRNAAAA
jgi:hypothetical protein